MKKWVFMLGLILLIGGNSSFVTTCNCWATAIVQTTDYISFPVCALDSATGVEAVPESVHIHVWRGSLTNTTIYSFREVGAGADLAQIDSVATGYAGAVPQQYYFHDRVEDIDGDGTAGVYTMNVRLWRGRTATSNWFSFQVVDSSFANALTRIGQINEDTKNLPTDPADDSDIDAQLADLQIVAEPYSNRKNLYCLPDSSAVVGGNATTWATACSLKSIVDKLTGAYEYYVHIAPGNHTGVNLSFSGEKMVTFVGAGIHRTILTGVDQSGLEYPVFCCDNSNEGDVIIQDMTIQAYNMQHDGIGIKDGSLSGFEIRRCRMGGFDKGISINSDSKKTIVENCFFSRCAGSAIYVNNEDATIRYNVIDSLTSSASYGISLNVTGIGSHIYGNIIYSAAGKGIGATNDAAAKNIIANNYVYAADGSYPEAYSNDNVYVGNHNRSERFAVDTTSTVEEDIYYSPRSAFSDSGWTVIRAGYLDEAISTRSAIGDTNTNPFQAGTDDVFLTANYTAIAKDAADSVWEELRADHTTGNTFGGDALDNDIWTDTKAGYVNMILTGIPTLTWGLDVSGYNAANAGTYLRTLRDHMPDPTVASTWKFMADTIWTDAKAGYLDESIAGLDDNPWDNDTGGVALGKYGSETMNHNQFHSSGDTNTFDITTQLANRPVIGDTNSDPLTAGDMWGLDLSGEAYDGDSTKAGDYVRFPKDSTATLGETADAFWGENDTTVIDTSKIGEWLIANISGGGSSNWSDAQRDSVLDYVDSSYAHIDSFFATVFGAGPDTTAIKGMMDGNYKDWWATLEPQVNRKDIFVSTSGNDDSSGLSWNGAVVTLRIAESKCTGADEYYVYVAPGTYSSTSCTTDVANVHWIGSGRERTFLAGTSGKPVMRIGANGIEITGFELAGGNDAIWINNSSHFNIHDNRMKNNTTHMGDGMLVFGSSHYGRIHGNFFHTQWGFCLSIQGDYNLVYNNIMDSLRTVAGTRAIIISATAKWNTIHNNKIHVEGSSHGIEIADGSGDNFIVDNYVYSGTVGQEYGELYSNATAYVANHGRSGRWEEDTTSTVEEDIYHVADSANNAIVDVNKGNFKADVSGLSTFDPASDSVMTSNPPAYQTDISGLSTFDPSTDVVVRVTYVDSAETVVTQNSGSDTTQISRWYHNNYDIDSSGSIDRVTYVDSTDTILKDVGATATVDSFMVRRAVHYATTSAYGDSTGTMGKALTDAASCNPSGSNTIIITIKRDSDSTAIIGAKVEAQTGEGGIYYVNTTNNSGQVSFPSDNDTLFVYTIAHPNTFTIPETLIIDGDENVTYYGTPFSPSAPPLDSVCVIYGYVKKKDGSAYVGAKVEIWMDAYPVTYQGMLIDVMTKTVEYTDSDGKFEFSNGIYYSSVLNPSNLKWKVRVKTSLWMWEGQITVPSADNWELEIPEL